MKSINEIIEFLENKKLIIETNIKENEEILDITYDSRDVKNGSAFFCKGLNFDIKYLDSAIEKGASIYISEIKYNEGFPYIIVSDIRKAMLYVAKFFFDNPDEKLVLLGVTGTKGKSTTVSILKGILDYALEKIGKKPTGFISGITTYDGIREFESHLTTPEAIELYRALNNCVLAGLEYAVVEVSSQALKYDRIGNAKFDVVGLLNIGSDHIGSLEHPTYEDYVSSKLKIFELSNKAVYSMDSKEISSIKEAAKNNDFKTFSIHSNDSDYKVENIIYMDGKSHFDFMSEEFDLNIYGEFNIENAACAILMLERIGIEPSISKEALSNLKIEGRSEFIISNDKNIVSFVNYAHNKLSFIKNFEMINSLYDGYKILSIFGASGGKGLNRREDLATVADKFSDKIFFAPDDPNYEDPIEIGKEMAGYLQKTNYKIFDSREKAIIEAFEYVEKQGDKWILFIAGKAEEEYQLVRGEYSRINSDIKVARNEMSKYNTMSK